MPPLLTQAEKKFMKKLRDGLESNDLRSGFFSDEKPASPTSAQ